jgi:hypothetical protein
MHSTLFSKKISKLYSEPSYFDSLALEIFMHQAKENDLYRSYLSLLKVKPKSVSKVSEIPCLPISFFKSKPVKSGNWNSSLAFKSSGTGGVQSVHHVRKIEDYLANSVSNFKHFFNSPKEYCFLALLPSYLEREGSSLIYMLDHFINLSQYDQSGFYLNQYDRLKDTLQACIDLQIPTILFGVPFGLLDFGEVCPMDLSDITIIETGGMKGRREEMTKSELYKILNRYFSPKEIYSEYGMTEMFSQAYAKKAGQFFSAPSMEVRIRELNDPFRLLDYGRLGAINIYDLANFDTISFIATEDIGRKYSDDSFRVLGRMDDSDLRGCNLLVDEI